MRYFLVAMLLALGSAAGFMAVMIVPAIPAALARTHSEARQFIFWGGLSVLLGAFWLAAAACVSVNRSQHLYRVVRFTARLVVGVGLCFAVIAPWSEGDAPVMLALAAACLSSGLLVHRYLGHRGERIHDA